LAKRRGRRAAEPPQERRLEDWLWDAACQIRGPLDAPKFKDYILPLIFLKRLSDVFDDEVARVADEVGDERTAQDVIDADRRLVRFYVPAEARWSFIRNPSLWEAVSKPPTTLGEALTDAVRAVARANPRLEGVIDPVDFNATAAGQPIVDNERLRSLIDVLSQRRLGLADVQPDLIGQAYEYLLRKFAEGQGQSAGEFYTPPEVARLMARILDPQPGMSVYDPACGSGGLLIKCHLRLLETHGAEVNNHRELPKDISPLQLAPGIRPTAVDTFPTLRVLNSKYPASARIISLTAASASSLGTRSEGEVMARSSHSH
jgi:type I restriction enzyme M protein